MLEQKVYIGILKEVSALAEIYFKIVSLRTQKIFKSEDINSPETRLKGALKMPYFHGSRPVSDIFCYPDLPSFLQFCLSTV